MFCLFFVSSNCKGMKLYGLSWQLTTDCYNSYNCSMFKNASALLAFHIFRLHWAKKVITAQVQTFLLPRQCHCYWDKKLRARKKVLMKQGPKKSNTDSTDSHSESNLLGFGCVGRARNTGTCAVLKSSCHFCDTQHITNSLSQRFDC